jgi:hypothetical protein
MNITDKKRLNWLSKQFVAVRTPLVYGSRILFSAMPVESDGDETPSDLRQQIDHWIRLEQEKSHEN